MSGQICPSYLVTLLWYEARIVVLTQIVRRSFPGFPILMFKGTCS